MNKMDFDIFEKLEQFNSLFRGEYNGTICVVKIGDKIYNEINALKILKHENIISLIHSYENQEKLYTLFEYFVGKNLYTWRINNMNEDVSQIIEQMCQAVLYIHSKDFIHGDLSAGNILINEKKKIKIVNFQHSCTTKEEGKISEFSSVYLSPEILNGTDSRVTKASDLWALGILIFLVLTGRHPFKGNSKKVIQHRMLNVKPKYKKYGIQNPYKKQIKNLLKRNPNNRKCLTLQNIETEKL